MPGTTTSVLHTVAHPLLHDLGKRTLVMGILNVTPDSFSDGGQYFDLERALEHAQDMAAAGADLIDIGAESTRPGYTALTYSEEWGRLEPILPLLREKVGLPLSLDTCKARVAEQALALGVNIVNDVWGGAKDPAMFSVVAASDAPFVMMHNANDRNPIVGDIVDVVCGDLLRQVGFALAAGVREQQIILDPGIGFGKTVAQNLALINQLDKIKELGFPVLVGTSRKSVIGRVLDLPVAERVEGTAATVAVAIARGADIVRVHDVREMVRVAKMTDSLVR
ncbi:MAG: dihydropteroate synthase [Bacilli bacterium]